LLSACLAGQQWAQGLALLKNCQEETVQGAAAKVLDEKWNSRNGEFIVICRILIEIYGNLSDPNGQIWVSR